MVPAMFSFVLYIYACIIIAQVSGDTVLCPGGTAECPRDNTCCWMSWGGYGCCPMLDATCCPDHKHCCPHGYQCSINRGQCIHGNKVHEWLTKTPAKPVNDTKCKDSPHCPDGSNSQKLRSDLDVCLSSDGFPCPGGSACCPNGNTCCITQTGGYSCCPYEDAVCCADEVHCCPQGYQCEGGCKKGNEVLAWVTRHPSRSAPPV